MGLIVPDMGFTEKDKSPVVFSALADALFSTTQQRVLGFLFGQPDRSFFGNELIALTAGGAGAIQRELKRLTESGLLTVKRLGNQKHYQANPRSPIFDELCGIAQKTFALALPLQAALTPLSKNIQAAFVFGSVAKRDDTAMSDIDLMIISDSVTYADVFGVLEEVGNRLGRQVNPTLYTSDGLAEKLAKNNAFAIRVMSQEKIFVIGDEDDLTT